VEAPENVNFKPFSRIRGYSEPIFPGGELFSRQA
jgi:hypothetical protein